MLNFKHYPDLTNEYMEIMEKNIVQQILENPESIRRFFPQINTEDAELEDDIDQEVGEIGSKIIQTAHTMTPNIITPWTIEKAKIADTTGLFHPIGKTLPIIVISDVDNQYLHECSEELVLGILIVVSSSNEFSLYFEEVLNFHNEEGTEIDPIQLDDISGNYTTRINTRFHAISSIGPIYFDTADVIQGIKTGASWLNQDPHNFIKDIRRDSVPVTF